MTIKNTIILESVQELECSSFKSWCLEMCACCQTLWYVAPSQLRLYPELLAFGNISLSASE